MWHVGVHRYVWVTKRLVLKFPRVPVGSLFETLKVFGLGKQGLRLMWSEVRDGFMENIREVHCFYTTRHPLLVRLYLPLVFVNVYAREEGVGHFFFAAGELYDGAWKSGDHELARALQPCSHTFDSRENFAYNKGWVKIIDYGERGFTNLLIKYGGKIEEFLLSRAQAE